MDNGMEYVGLNILEEVGPPQKQTVCITECQWYMAVTITVEHDTTDDIKVNKQKVEFFIRSYSHGQLVYSRMIMTNNNGYMLLQCKIWKVYSN